MIFKDWEPIYNKIADDFGYPLEKEMISADILNNILDKNSTSLNKLSNFLKDKHVVIFGAGHSLDMSMKKNRDFYINKTKIVADGATTALLKCDVQPDIIVTDLDGIISDQIIANKNGSLVVLHAHGDNIETIKRYATEFQNNVIGTIQIDPSPYKNLFNFGGFTDGDRAIFIADHFQAKKITLMGFDFDFKIGNYSCIENKDITQKFKKLKWCKYLIKLIKKNNINIDYR